MTDLMPGRTVVAVRQLEFGSGMPQATFPYRTTSVRPRGVRWLLDGARYATGLTPLRPAQTSVARYLQRHGARVILAEYLDWALRWLPVARQLDLPFFAHAHGCDVSSALRDPQTRRAYLGLTAADGIVTMSQYSRQRLVELGLAPDRIHVIPYGVDVPDAPILRKAGDVVRCLAVGRMVGKKAPLKTLESFRLALRQNPALQLDYVGNGPLYEQAARFVFEWGLGGHIRLHGRQPNSFVQGLLRECDIFLQHSITDPVTGDQEGLPVAILEAMAMALPVLATQHAGIPEAVIHGESGLLVEEGDSTEMASALLQLAANPSLRKDFGLFGWRLARENYTWDLERHRLLATMGISQDVRT